METLLLTQPQKELFVSFSKQEGNCKLSEQEEEIREKDPFYDYYHERTDSNYNKLIALTPEQFEELKSFLKIPIGKLVSQFHYLKELQYCHIETLGDALSTDWVYFPVYDMRRTMLNFLGTIIGAKLNFVLCLSKEQKIMLQNHVINFDELVLAVLMFNKTYHEQLTH